MASPLTTGWSCSEAQAGAPRRLHEAAADVNKISRLLAGGFGCPSAVRDACAAATLLLHSLRKAFSTCRTVTIG